MSGTVKTPTTGRIAKKLCNLMLDNMEKEIGKGNRDMAIFMKCFFLMLMLFGLSVYGRAIQPPKRFYDLRKQPFEYLIVNKIKLDKNTTIDLLEKHFAGHYQDASRGTAVDVWTVLFLDTFPKSKYQWMLYFDAKTEKLKTITYIKI